MECPSCHYEAPEESAFCARCGSSFRPGSSLPLSTKTLSMIGLDFQAGQIISGKYRLTEVVGRGGMGVVYKAEDTVLKRWVALKFLRPEFLVDAEAKARFLLEARIAASIDHPHICPVYEVNEENDRTYIVMPFVDGASLREKTRRGGLGLREGLDLGIQIAEGLAEAHRCGIIHRDMKAANIMLTEKGQAKIMDFGLAKLLQGSDITTSTKVMGTVSYMSPEQARGEALDARTDVWSLGIVLYEIFSGRLPFEQRPNHALLYAIIHSPPASLPETATDVPEAFIRVMERCLEKERDQRYENAEGVAEDLRRIRDGLTVVARPVPAPRPAKPARRIPKAAAAVLLALVPVLVYLVFFKGGKDGKEPAPPATPVRVAASAVLPIEALAGDGTASVRLPEGSAFKPGATGRVLSGPELDRDGMRRPIGDFFAAAVQPGVMTIRIVGSTETVRRGDYIEPAGRPQGTILIQTDPPGVEILVDGSAKGQTSASLLLDPATYRITLKKSGYAEKTETIELRAGDVVERKYRLIEAAPPAPPQAASLLVDSNPQGAGIFVDGAAKPEALTPARISLRPGRHRIRVSGAGYEDEMIELAVQGGQSLERSVPLRPSDVLLEIDSTPADATVEIGPQPGTGGRTPFAKALPPGRYSIKIRKPGYVDAGEDIVLAAGAPVKRRFELAAVPKAAPNVLVLNSIPEGARVLLDDVEKGFTPFKGEVSAAQVQVRLTKPGYREVTETIGIKAGETWKNYGLVKLGRGKVALTAFPQATVEIDGERLANKVPPLATVEVEEGTRTIKFLFDDSAELVKKVEVPANGLVRVNGDKEAEGEAILQKSDYEISAFPRARILIDGETKGDTPPVRSMKVREGEHLVQFLFSDPAGPTIDAGIHDPIASLQRKKLHASLDRGGAGRPEAAAPDAAEEGAVTASATVPVAVELAGTGTPAQEASPGRPASWKTGARGEYRFGLRVKNPQDGAQVTIDIVTKSPARTIRLVVTIATR